MNKNDGEEIIFLIMLQDLNLYYLIAVIAVVGLIISYVWIFIDAIRYEISLSDMWFWFCCGVWPCVIFRYLVERSYYDTQIRRADRKINKKYQKIKNELKNKKISQETMDEITLNVVGSYFEDREIFNEIFPLGIVDYAIKRDHENYVRHLIEISPENTEEVIKWLNKIQIEVEKLLIKEQYKQAIPLIKSKIRLYNFAIDSFKKMNLMSMVPSLENELTKHYKLHFETFHLNWTKEYEIFSKNLEIARQKGIFSENNSALIDIISHIDNRIKFAEEMKRNDDVPKFTVIKEKFITMQTINRCTNQYKQQERRFNDLLVFVEKGNLTSALNESKQLKQEIEKLLSELRINNQASNELASLLNATDTLLKRFDRFESDISNAFQSRLKGITANTIDLSRVSAQIILPEIIKIKMTTVHIPLYAKIVLLGESSVGKTHLVLSMTNGAYSPTQGSTVGVDKFYTPIKLPIEGYDPQLCFWDLGGQWNFRAVNELFLREASVILLVFDMTRPETFTELEYWVEMVKTAKSSHIQNIFIIGNKIDVGGSAIASSRIENFLKENNLKYFYKTSAVTKENIKNLLEDIAGAVDWSGLLREVPSDILSAVENELKTLAKHTKIEKLSNVMNHLKDRLRTIDPIMLKAVLKKNAAQEIVQFGRSELFIILDPEVIDKIIAKIIATAADANGIVSFDEILGLKSLRELDGSQKKLLMIFLENEKVCYSIRKDTWLFPHVLHQQEKEITPDHLTLALLDSEPISGAVKFTGPGDLIFSRFTVLVAQEIGIPEKVSNIAGIWKIGSGHNKTAIITQFSPAPSGGMIRLKAGGGQGSKQFHRILEILHQILSIYASKYEDL